MISKVAPTWIRRTFWVSVVVAVTAGLLLLFNSVGLLASTKRCRTKRSPGVEQSGLLTATIWRDKVVDMGASNFPDNPANKRRTHGTQNHP